MHGMVTDVARLYMNANLAAVGRVLMAAPALTLAVPYTWTRLAVATSV